MEDARAWVQDFMLMPDGKGFKSEPVLRWSLHGKHCLLSERLHGLRERDVELYLKVVEYCFTRHADMRGEIGALLGRGYALELMQRLFEIFMRVCAAEPPAAVAAYLNIDNPLVGVLNGGLYSDIQLLRLEFLLGRLHIDPSRCWELGGQQFWVSDPSRWRALQAASEVRQGTFLHYGACPESSF